MRVEFQFKELRAYRTHKGHCPVCGRKVRRSRMFRQTVNPYHPAVTWGMSQEAAEKAVREALTVTADEWEPDFTHTNCQAKADAP